MAQSVGNIHVNLVVNTGSSARFSSAANVISRDSNRMRRALDGSSRSVSALRAQTSQGIRSRLLHDMVRQATAANNELGLLRSTMLGLAAITGTSLTGAFAGTYLLETADRAHLLSNQLRTVTTDSENLAAVQERLYQLSQRTRSGMESTIKVYARTARATEHLGYSQENLVRITETIQKAFAVGGASTQEAMGAAIQLSQGIASDRFSGEEFRSVAENAPVLLMAMADTLDVNIGKLREMAHAGELTADVVTRAILEASDAVDADFDKLGVTVGQAMTRVHNAFLMYIGDVDKAHGVTASMASILTNLSENFGEVAHWAGIALGAIATIAGSKMFAGITGGAYRHTFGAFATQQKAAENYLATLKRQSAETAATAAQQKKLEMAQQRRYHAAWVAANRTMGAEKTIVAAQRKQERELRKLNVLRQQGVSLGKRQLALQEQIAIATRNTSRLARAANMLKGGLVNVFSFLGGWTGISFFAAIAGLTVMAERSAAAAARTERLKKELHELGLISDEVAGVMERTAKSLDDLADDELRNKIRDIREEIQALTGEQGFLDKLFSYNPQNLDNIVRQIDHETRGILRGNFTLGPASGDESASAAMRLRELVTAAQAGEVSLEDLLASLDEIATAVPDDAPWLDKLISDFRMAAPYLEGLRENLGRVSAEMERVGDENPILRTVAAQEQYAEALARSAESAAILGDLVDEEVRQSLLSEDAAELEKVMAALRKEWEDIAEESDNQLKIDEALLRTEAQRVVAAKKTAEAMEASREAIQEYADEINEVVRALESMPEIGDNADAVAAARELVREYMAGERTAAELRSELTNISGLNISGGMSDLIDRIQAAIPMAQALRNVLLTATSWSFGGGIGGGDALRGEVLGADLQERLRRAGMTPDQQHRDDLITELMGGVDGFSRTREEAEAAADAIIKKQKATDALVESMKPAKTAAEKFAEGMAELRHETELAGMDAFWKEVVDAAGGMGIANDEITEFIQSVQSGGLDAAPEKFREIAGAIRELNDAQINAELGIERQKLLMNDLDQSIYERLAGTGIEYTSVQGQIIAEQMRFNDSLARSREVFVSFWDDVASGLQEGKTLWESMGDAALNALNSIASQLVTMGAQGVFGAIVGGGIGGGGFGNAFGGGGFLSSLFGGRGFATGGYTGAGDPKAVAGLAHRGEFVFDAPATRRIGISRLEAMRSGALQNATGASGLQLFITNQIDAKGAELGVDVRIAHALDRWAREVAPSVVQGIIADPHAVG